ncbi:MAG: DUF4932 domain-containing protein [Victivallales bacterium]|nr:DUF4932 domain-containing protein [Victivallales bacterium]
MVVQPLVTAFECTLPHIRVMKRKVVFLCGLLSMLTSLAQNPIPVQFDECIDLMAVVWRLSGAHEYNNMLDSHYLREIDAFFAPYKEHPVVQLARQYQQESDISYDAVASYGFHLLLTDDGTLMFNDRFSEGGDVSFDRWSAQQKTEFLEPLNDFYRTSHFHEWYLRQNERYENAKKAFHEINQKVDYDWFSNYFGTPCGSGTFRIVLSLLAGPHNYGCNAQLKNGGKLFSPVIGCCLFDPNGNCFFNENVVLPIVIHEFCHGYCNPLTDQFWPSMSQTAEKVFQQDARQLTQSAYGLAIVMMYETFVRVCVIRYMKTHNPQMDESELIRAEENQGFILVRTLCDKLKKYEQQRDTYATMGDFMPIYAQAVNDFDLEQYTKWQQEQSKLDASYKVNIPNGASDIPSGSFVLVIQFSKPMKGGIALGRGPSGTVFPTVVNYSWPDDRTLNVTLSLEPSHQYGFSVLGSLFFTKDGHDAGETTEITFTTGE